LEADPDFQTLFGDAEREAFRDFTRRLQGSWTPEDIDQGRRANDRRMEWMRRFRAMGGTLLAGTDMQFGGIMLHREVRNLEALGMTSGQVIAAATGTAARALGLDADVGTIRPSRHADLVVLDGDPLADLGALHAIACVLKGGAAAWSDGRPFSLPPSPPSYAVAPAVASGFQRPVLSG